MNRLRISNSDTDNFLSCVKNSIDESHRVKPYNELKDALVFSFDAELNAFSNYSKGWHKNRQMRPYLENRPRIVEKLEEMMIPYRQTGGRVFVDNEYAYFVNRQSKRTDLCKLAWPKGRNVVDEIRGYWNARRRPTLTLTKVFAA